MFSPFLSYSPCGVSLFHCGCISLPPSLPTLQPEELTLLLIKLRRQQAELNSIREHTVAQLMQLNMDGDNPKVRPSEIPLQACVLECGVYAIFAHFHYSFRSKGFLKFIYLWSSHMADLRRKSCSFVGTFSVENHDFALNCLLILFWDQLVWFQLYPKHKEMSSDKTFGPFQLGEPLIRHFTSLKCRDRC